MKHAFKALVLAGAMAVTTVAAQAATLSIQGGNLVKLGPLFSLTDATGLDAETEIRSFNSTNIAGNGLFLDGGPSMLRFTFIGREAAATNLASVAIDVANPVGPSSNALELFNNQTSAVGSFVDRYNLEGLVNFLFQTSGLDGAPGAPNLNDGITSGTAGNSQFAIIRNGTGADDPRISLGLFQNKDGSVFAFFGDGRGDGDGDDLVLQITAIPLPAGGLLLLTAFAGVAALRRRKTA